MELDQEMLRLAQVELVLNRDCDELAGQGIESPELSSAASRIVFARIHLGMVLYPGLDTKELHERHLDAAAAILDSQCSRAMH